MPGLIDNHVHIFMGANTQNDMLDPKATPEILHGGQPKKRGRCCCAVSRLFVI